MEAIKLLEAIDETLRNRFNELREKHFNPNTKGYEYEMALKEFLESYLSGLFDFHVRVPLIDFELEAPSIFSSGENEFDVVSTYKTALPKIIFKAGETPYIPLDSVAFVVEVKQTLTSSVLQHDLEKMEKLNKLKTSNRFGVTISGAYAVEKPLKILFYYESEMPVTKAVEMLNSHTNAWDFMLILMDDIVFGNPNLPVIGKQLNTDKIVPFTQFDDWHDSIASLSAHSEYIGALS